MTFNVPTIDVNLFYNPFFSLVMVLSCLAMAYWTLKRAKKNERGCIIDDAAVFRTIVSIVVGLGFFITMWINVYAFGNQQKTIAVEPAVVVIDMGEWQSTYDAVKMANGTILKEEILRRSAKLHSKITIEQTNALRSLVCQETWIIVGRDISALLDDGVLQTTKNDFQKASDNAAKALDDAKKAIKNYEEKS